MSRTCVTGLYASDSAYCGNYDRASGSFVANDMCGSAGLKSAQLWLRVIFRFEYVHIVGTQRDLYLKTRPLNLIRVKCYDQLRIKLIAQQGRKFLYIENA